ncbi:hypothetical protein [Hydrogenovibrio marinus]|uniref:Uncharacterized protein n=1 Tax=Hydrogenovibrio marinus TaxID=28885 RepID=A0A066ZQS8_HYDMR|nr:hypothetical protein [Hydrogenovibrio marinus]KDN94619.1 hypothetical protein EI16_11995 [Hydrogenovibrio marinus]
MSRKYYYRKKKSREMFVGDVAAIVNLLPWQWQIILICALTAISGLGFSIMLKELSLIFS